LLASAAPSEINISLRVFSCPFVAQPGATYITDNIATPGDYGGTQGNNDFSLTIRSVE
jgi:hypothetical protein